MRERGTITIIAPRSANVVARLRHASPCLFSTRTALGKGSHAEFPRGTGFSDAFGLDNRVLGLREVDEAVQDVSANQFDAQLVADIETLGALR